MGYQAILDNIRGQTGNSMGDIRDSDTRSSDQYYTNNGNPMGYYDTNYQQQGMGRYVPPMIIGDASQPTGWANFGSPYNYNIPTAFGGYGNGSYGNYGNYGAPSWAPIGYGHNMPPTGYLPSTNNMGPMGTQPPPLASPGGPSVGPQGPSNPRVGYMDYIRNLGTQMGSYQWQPLNNGLNPNPLPAASSNSMIPPSVLSPQVGSLGTGGSMGSPMTSTMIPSTAVAQPPMVTPPVSGASLPASDGPTDWTRNYYNNILANRRRPGMMPWTP